MFNEFFYYNLLFNCWTSLKFDLHDFIKDIN
jgi:hypothetical protein